MNAFHRLFFCSAVSAVALAQQASAAVETYTIDATHSSIGFSLRHFVSKVPGSFTKFSGTLTIDRAHLENSSVTATVEIASVSTANEKRDEHLRSPDFFDVGKFPSATFVSTAWKKTGDDTFDITGDLTLKGVTKQIVLKAKLLGFGPGMQGAQLSGWEATVVLNKADFGVNGPAMLGKALGDDVAVTLSVEADLTK